MTEKSINDIDDKNNPLCFEVANEQKNDQNLLKNTLYYIKTILGLLIGNILLLLIFLIIVFAKGLKSSNQDIEKSSGYSKKYPIDPEDPDESFYEENLISIAELPFALQFTYGNAPGKIYSALEKSVVKVTESINEIDIVNNVYISSLERNIDIATGVNSFSSSETKKQLISSIISIDHFENTFREAVQLQIYKGFVSILVRRMRIKVETSEIKIEQLYLDQITQILNSTSNYDRKVKKLFDTFQTLGYFVPLQVVVGGRIDLLFEEETEEQTKQFAFKLEVESSAVSSKLNNTDKVDSKAFSSHKTLDIKNLGGQVDDLNELNTVEGLKKWYSSLGKDNYNIIAYENIVPITNFFPRKLKELYEQYEQDISRKFNDIYEKYQTLMYASKQKVLQSGENGKEWTCGSQEYDSQVQKITKTIFVDYKFARKTEYNFSETVGTNKYIVGFKIKENRGDSNNGKWEIKGDTNTIIRNSIEIKFTSKRSYEQNWIVEIYYVDFNV